MISVKIHSYDHLRLITDVSIRPCFFNIQGYCLTPSGREVICRSLPVSQSMSHSTSPHPIFVAGTHACVRLKVIDQTSFKLITQTFRSAKPSNCRRKCKSLHADTSANQSTLPPTYRKRVNWSAFSTGRLDHKKTQKKLTEHTSKTGALVYVWTNPFSTQCVESFLLLELLGTNFCITPYLWADWHHSKVTGGPREWDNLTVGAGRQNFCSWKFGSFRLIRVQGCPKMYVIPNYQKS